MQEPLDQTPSTLWVRLRRMFQFEGKLGGLRYSAQVRILELNASEPLPSGNEILSVPEQKRLADSSIAASATDGASGESGS